MNLRRIKHAFLRLTSEEKVTGLGCLMVFAGIFMPWYSVVMNLDKESVTENGLSGDLGVLGFVVLLMIILSFLVLIGEYLYIRLPRLGYTKEQILFFLMGQSAFLILLAVAIYTKRSLEFLSANLRFGIYLALIGAFLGAFAILSQTQKLKKKEVSEFFGHENESIKDTKKKKKKHTEEEYDEEIETADEEAKLVSGIPEEDQMLFEDETKVVILDEKIPADDTAGETDEPEPEPEIEPESEDEDKLESEKEESEWKEKSKPATQRDYFMREASLETSGSESDEAGENEEKTEPEEAEEPDEKEEEKKDKGLSMGFYEDQ